MASKDEKPQKKQSLFKQIAQIYKFTVADDKKLPWLLAGAWLAPVVLFVILGLVFHWTWLTWIFVMVMAIMVGALFATMTLTNRADKVGYAHLEGKPGAAVSVLSNISKAGFNFPEQPVWFDAKTKDAIWRGTGFNGIYLLGEGDYGRVMRAMDRHIKGVTAGSQIPVYRICVGTGDKQVKLKDLRKTIVKQRAYVPSGHKNKLVAKIHPRSRFLLTQRELDILNDRLRTLQTKTVCARCRPSRAWASRRASTRPARSASAVARCVAADGRRPRYIRHMKEPPDRAALLLSIPVPFRFQLPARVRQKLEAG